MAEQTWVVGSIRKNGASEVRVSVDQYKGKTYVCTECGWNNGVRIWKNRFGCRESSRECLCFGCLPTWQHIKKCKALKPKEPHHD